MGHKCSIEPLLDRNAKLKVFEQYDAIYEQVYAKASKNYLLKQ
jgi:hypothetical protein